MRSATKALLLSLFLPVAGAAQVGRPTVVVSDTAGRRIAFAWVQVSSGVARVANDSGVVLIEADAVDSLRLIVRRMGYAPFDGKVARDVAANAFTVVLTPTPQALKRLQVTSIEDNRLFRNGFYARLENAKKIATPARFFTPEDLDARPVSRTSQIFEGINFLIVRREERKSIIQGRGRCPGSILLDGKILTGMVEELLTPKGEQEIARRSRRLPPSVRQEDRDATARQEYLRELSSIDDVLAAGSIAAVEVYASAHQAPSELRMQADNPTCVLVAIWTGPRQ